MVRRVGIVGFGHLGQYLCSCIEKSELYELAFVWNRTKSVLDGRISQHLVLNDLSEFASKSPDIIVEVSHPSISTMYGKLFLQYCDYMIGSPTALCDLEVEQTLLAAASVHGLYVPSGAFWGGEDIKKMADSGTLKALMVTMKKHPSSLKLEGKLKEINLEVKDCALTIYKGPVRGVCSLAPHNTNTMAAAAIAGHNLGFDQVQGHLVSDPSLTNYHIVEVEVEGFPKSDGSCFHVHTVRRNPAALGEVTGSATYAAYFASLERAEGKGSGFHLC